MDFSGKTVLVTGAGQGIGRDVTGALLRAGAAVIATDRNGDALSEIETVTHALDVTDQKAVSHVFGTLDRLDGLFNCAGVVHSGTVEDASDAQWHTAFDVNVRGPARCIRAAMPLLLSRGGAIVNMASVVSSVTGAPDRCVYGTTKAALIGLTKSVAKDYVTKGVRCNAVCPGTVKTPSLEDRLRQTGDYEAALAEFTSRQPMGRIASSEDITPLVLYLLSGASNYMTGQAIAVDGGWSG